jgi:hypothetical protein
MSSGDNSYIYGDGGSSAEHLSLNNPSPGYTTVLHHAPIAVLLAILLAICTTEKHGTCRIPPTSLVEKGVGLHYKRFYGGIPLGFFLQIFSVVHGAFDVNGINIDNVTADGEYCRMKHNINILILYGMSQKV